jgi:hypothetical protein
MRNEKNSCARNKQFHVRPPVSQKANKAGSALLDITQLGDDELIRACQSRSCLMWIHFQGRRKMLHRRTLITGAVLALAGASSIPSAFAASKQTSVAKVPNAASWDGTWSGRSSNGGRTTTVKISKGKVTFWTNNGYPRPKVIGSVSGDRVVLDDQNGWKATIVLLGEGKARITARGIGNNGRPAKNSAELTKR